MDSIVSTLFSADASLANIYSVYLISSAALGILFGVFGRRLFYFWMAFTGMAIGFIAIKSLGGATESALAVGFLFAVLNIFMYQIGLVVVGFFAGIAIFGLIFVGFPLGILITFMGGVIGAIMAVAVADLLIVVSTSFFGAGLVTYFVFSLVGLATGNTSSVVSATNFISSMFDYSVSYGAAEAIAVGFAYTALLVVTATSFVVVQYLGLKKIKRKEQEKELARTEKIKNFLSSRLDKNSIFTKAIYKFNPHLNPDAALMTRRQAEMTQLRDSYKETGENLVKAWKEQFSPYFNSKEGSSGAFKKIFKWALIIFLTPIVLMLALFIF